MLAVANFLVPNPTALVEVDVFAAVFGVMARFVLPRLKVAMDRRQAEIGTSIETSKRAEQLLAKAEADYQAKMNDARKQARASSDTGRRVGDHLRQEGRRRGQEEHDRLVARAQGDIDRALALAREELHDEASRLGVTAPPLLGGPTEEPACD